VTLAIRDGHSGNAGLLIDKGAAVHAADGEEKSPLILARDESL
jgi:hypothetical protein